MRKFDEGKNRTIASSNYGRQRKTRWPEKEKALQLREGHGDADDPGWQRELQLKNF
jgi:hypothetical protein